MPVYLLTGLVFCSGGKNEEAKINNGISFYDCSCFWCNQADPDGSCSRPFANVNWGESPVQPDVEITGNADFAISSELPSIIYPPDGMPNPV